MRHGHCGGKLVWNNRTGEAGRMGEPRAQLFPKGAAYFSAFHRVIRCTQCAFERVIYRKLV